MPLFDPTKLRLLARQYGTPREEARARLEIITRLRQRRQDTVLTTRAETRVEQSFNERVFCELFDYSSMFRQGKGDYELEAKTHHKTKFDKNGRYDDFSLGFFSGEHATRIASVELKPANTDLDAPQAGGYEGRSPVQQAFHAATETPGVEWVVVSNFDEIRLYAINSVDPQDRYECIHLSNILSVNDFAQAYALLGRPTLLGKQGTPSPLLQLLHGKTPMIVDKLPRRLRLVQEAKLALDQDFGFHELEDSLKNALDESLLVWPGIDHTSPHPTLEGDRIVLTNEAVDSGACRIEIVRDGTIRISEHIPDWHKSSLRQLESDESLPISQFDDDFLAVCVARFVKFVHYFYLELIGQINTTIRFHSELMDSKGAQYLMRRRREPDRVFTCTQEVDRIFATKDNVPFVENDGFEAGIPSVKRLEVVTYAVRELLFPFEHVDTENQNRRSRHRHNRAEIEDFLTKRNMVP